MSIPFTIIVPGYFNHILGVLGLLLLWKLHQIQVKTGRIEAVDFWARSGIRMFIHVTPGDLKACPSCQEANGKVFSPANVGKKKFSPLSRPCTNTEGCRCLLVGLYGGWPDAQRLLLRLKAKPTSVQLSDEELKKLLGGSWERYSGAAGDRIPVHLLEAMLLESKDPEAAIFRYRFVEENARRDRDFPFVVHSFIRQSELLERVGRLQEAMASVDRFLKIYDGKRRALNLPIDGSYSAMSNRKKRLRTVLK